MFIFPSSGHPEALLRLARRKVFLLYISDAIAEEIEEVLINRFADSKATLHVAMRKLRASFLLVLS